MRTLTAIERRDRSMRQARMHRSSYRSGEGNPNIEPYRPQMLKSVADKAREARLINWVDMRARKEVDA